MKNQHAPAFARKNSTDHLLQVPVFYSSHDETNYLYAVCDTNQQTFTLYSNNHEIGSYDLPVYKDHQGTVEKIALTPVAATADVTVVGTVAAVLVAYSKGGGVADPIGGTIDLVNFFY